MRCSNCGEKMTKNLTYCTNCGAKIKKKKRFVFLIILLIVLAVIVNFVGCVSLLNINNGVSETAENETNKNASVDIAEKEENDNFLSENELNLAYSNPDKYKGRKIKVSGQIFSEPEYDDTYIAFQMFADAENNEKNTVVIGLNDSLDLKSDDYVIIEGEIMGAYDGENSFGGTINAVQIMASKIKKSNYQTVVCPAIKTKKVNETVKQYGYSITLKKVEFAEKETRLYFKINNNGTDEFNFYSFNTKILQGNNQYEEQPNYDADYEEPQNNLMVGAKTEGIITFPPLDENKEFKVHCDASSNNWNEDIEEFVFTVK